MRGTQNTTWRESYPMLILVRRHWNAIDQSLDSSAITFWCNII